jgi:hypothetical protein
MEDYKLKDLIEYKLQSFDVVEYPNIIAGLTASIQRHIDLKIDRIKHDIFGDQKGHFLTEEGARIIGILNRVAKEISE